MKIKTERDKRTYLIIALCAILVVMGAGYAAFSSLLTINGTANVTNSWCVGFDNNMTSAMEVTKGVSTGTTPTGSMSYSGTACGSSLQPNSSLNAHFYQPGDEIEYTLTIANKSTVTAAIKSFTINNEENITSNWTHTDGNITYTVNMPSDTTLDPNETTTMTVIAKFQNESDVTGNVNGETKTLNVSIDVQQDDGNGGMVVTEPKFTGTIYRKNTNVTLDGLPMNGEGVVFYRGYQSAEQAHSNYFAYSSEELCETGPGSGECSSGTILQNIGTYTTDASTLNSVYYLRHDVENDIITATYACFVTDEEHCLKIGRDNYENNMEILQEQEEWFNNNSGSCSTQSNGSFSCQGAGGLSAITASTYSSTGYQGSYCVIGDRGNYISYCR